MTKIKSLIYNVIPAIIFMVVLWMMITSFIFWVKNSDLSEMQVFLHTPKSFILDFERKDIE